MSGQPQCLHMKLAVVIGAYDPKGGGAERSTAQIVHELASRGHDVTVITDFYPEDYEFPGVTIDCRPRSWLKSPWWLWGFSRSAKRRLQAGEFDASLSVATVVPASVVQPRGGTVRETQQCNVQMRRGVWPQLVKRLLLWMSIKQQVLLALERGTLADPMVKRVAAVSRYVVDQLRRHYELESSQISLIPNASQMPVVNDQTHRVWRKRVREGFNIPEGPPVYLFAAHNPRLKGIDALLEATKQLHDRGVELTLLLAGGITYAHQHRIAEMGIRRCVRVIATTDRMAELYAATDVTVLPTFYDPSSKVVIESLMMGKPSISTSLNGASDWILGEDGQELRGRVIQDPSDVDALAKAMEELADPVERRRCEAAMKGIAESLSMKRHVDQLEGLLAEVAER